MFEKLMSKVKGAWDALDYVPDCPACGGTGEPSDESRAWSEVVWWKGEQYRVCHNCHGRGKV